jgi:hypothetical protein
MQHGQNPFQWPGAPAGQPQAPAPVPAGYVQAPAGYAPAGIAPASAGSPVPGPAYGQYAPGPAPQPTGYGPAPAGPAPVGLFNDPFAAVAGASLTRGQKLFLKAEDLVLAELVGAKLVNGQKGVAQVFELRVLWSERGVNVVGSEPSTVLKQGHYFGSEVKTWMCALLGLVAGRDGAVIDQIDRKDGEWSRLCALADHSPDGKLQGPGPFAGTIIRLEVYKKLKVDRWGKEVLDPQTQQKQYVDLARPEAVSPHVGPALQYMRACANPAQDPQAQQHYATIKAALERSLAVPAYDSNALAARIQRASAPPAAPPAQPAPVPGYGQAGPPVGYGYGAPPAGYGPTH